MKMEQTVFRNVGIKNSNAGELHKRKQEKSLFLLTPPIKMEKKQCSETSAYEIQTPGTHLKERIQHTEHDESLKSKILNMLINEI